MKYAIIIPDGAADRPIEQLGGKTPLAVAEKPNMDWIAAQGKCGTVRTIPRGMAAGSDVAILSLLGYDPRDFYTGRAPLEAAARGLKVSDEEWIFRCNLVTVINGVMEDHSAGHISTEEASALLQDLSRRIASDDLAFYPGVGYRHLMTYRGELGVRTTPPHDILGRSVASYLPTGKGSKELRRLMEYSREVFDGHEINEVRKDLGENPATTIWLWGEGKMPQLPPFRERFGISGAAITAVDLVRGIAKLIGWEIIEVPGATGYLDTNYAGKGSAAVEALDSHDLICVHIEAPDEAGHNADAAGKIQALQEIDRHIVGPILDRLRREGDQWRVLLLPDHPTPVEVRTHTADPVPFALAGRRVESVVTGPFNEESGELSDLHIDHGCELMEFFLTVR